MTKRCTIRPLKSVETCIYKAFARFSIFTSGKKKKGRSSTQSDPRLTPHSNFKTHPNTQIINTFAHPSVPKLCFSDRNLRLPKRNKKYLFSTVKTAEKPIFIVVWAIFKSWNVKVRFTNLGRFLDPPSGPESAQSLDLASACAVVVHRIV